MSWSLSLSTSGSKFLTVSESSYSSRPSNVTVKFITASLILTSGRKWGFEIFVVKNNLKFLLYSIVLSPILILYNPYSLKTAFEAIYSIVGSISYDMSSMSRMLPFFIDSSIIYWNWVLYDFSKSYWYYIFVTLN